MQKKETGSSQQSIERALKLLTIMGESRTAMNITEISRLLHISRSTTYAMVNVMTEMNFLSKDSDTGKYFLGYQIFSLGSMSRIRYSHIMPCDDYLKTFAKQTTLSLNRVGIMVLEQDYMVLNLLNNDIRSPVNHFMEQRIMPSFCTASGKVLLAALPVEQQHEALEWQHLNQFTNATVTEPAAILIQLEQIGALGYAVDIEEYFNFEVNIAVPLKDYSGKTVAAVNVSVPKLIYQNHSDNYLQTAIALGQELSSILGFRNF